MRRGPLAGIFMSLILLIFAGCGTSTSSGGLSGRLNIDGSTALQPLTTQAALEFQQIHDNVTVSVSGGGSKKGLSDVAAGAVQIGNSDIFADSTTTPGLVDHQVAIVPFSLIVNNDVPVQNLTTAQIQQVYTGQVMNWNQVGGPDLPIVVVSRPATSGTRATFKQYVLNGQEEKQGLALTQDSTSAVASAVSTTNGAIGYVASGGVQPYAHTIHTVNIDGHSPSASDVESNAYHFWNIEHMYTKGNPTSIEQAFLEYMMTDKVQKTDGPNLGFVPISSMSHEALVSHGGS